MQATYEHDIHHFLSRFINYIKAEFCHSWLIHLQTPKLTSTRSICCFWESVECIWKMLGEVYRGRSLNFVSCLPRYTWTHSMFPYTLSRREADHLEGHVCGNQAPGALCGILLPIFQMGNPSMERKLLPHRGRLPDLTHRLLLWCLRSLEKNHPWFLFKVREKNLYLIWPFFFFF